MCEGGMAAVDAVKPHLVALLLKATAIGPTEGDAIAKLVKGCRDLTSLDIGFNNLDEQLALAIVKAAQGHDKLTSLGLGSCKLHAHGAQQVAAYSASSAALTSLDLEYK